MSIKKWIINKVNKERATLIAEEFNTPFFLAVIFDSRGITSKQQIESILSFESSLSNPLKFIDMDKAVFRIKKAIESFEKICIYGDYDADGITSTVVLYTYLESCGANVMYYIPKREDEGYGLNIPAIDYIKQQDVSLIITVDNGIVSIDEIDYANSLGIETIVTDHHQPRNILPNAVAVLDPYRKDCESEFKNLAGVGVAFKLVSALEGERTNDYQLLDNYADLIAIGTIADVVPIIGENKVFVKRGLELIGSTDRLGLRALIDEAGINNKNLNTTNISFTIVPRINASGRMGTSLKAVKLLLCEDIEQASCEALEISKDNQKRQRIGQEILKDVFELLEREPHRIHEKVLVIEGEGWHNGIVGIVASKITEKYGKPCIILSVEGELAKGSGRSIKGFSLYDAVCSGKEYLTRFGGHPLAVGLNMYSKDIDDFRKAVNNYAKSQDEMPCLTLEVDCKLNPSAISIDLVNQLSLLEPFGYGNSKPIFALMNMELVNITILSGGKHLKLLFKKNDKETVAMKFFMQFNEFPYEVGDVLDLAITLDSSEYMGMERVSIIINDMRVSNINYDDYFKQKQLYDALKCGENIDKKYLDIMVPRREDFAIFYRFMKAKKYINVSIDVIYNKLQKVMSFGKIFIIIDAMTELGLLETNVNGDIYKIKLNSVTKKVDLWDASVFDKLIDK